MIKDYSQPDFYRFNEDSLNLVKLVLREVLKAGSVLDLGSGCGVMGIEVARVLKPKVLTLVELQDDFIPYLYQNIRDFLPSGVEADIFHGSFSRFHPQRKYDLIVCNPPYYLPGRGKASPDIRRQLARTFMKDGWEVLSAVIRECLTDEGKAYVVRDQKFMSFSSSEDKWKSLFL